MEWSGVEWGGVDWNGVERGGVEWSGKVLWHFLAFVGIDLHFAIDLLFC